jgi:hypothetical protein
MGTFDVVGGIELTLRAAILMAAMSVVIKGSERCDEGCGGAGEVVCDRRQPSVRLMVLK